MFYFHFYAYNVPRFNVRTVEDVSSLHYCCVLLLRVSLNTIGANRSTYIGETNEQLNAFHHFVNSTCPSSYVY